jgi:histidinol-phosphate phosphatase family protein
VPATRVAFLDRDGVINADSEAYIKSVAEFHLLPGSVDAIAALYAAGWQVIIVTNQSALRRGLLSPDELERIHNRMRRAVARAGGRIRDIYYCPHCPDDHCDCRKPRPGMIFRAQRIHCIDLSQAVMIGDSARDIVCGLNAGCGCTILVETGNGRTAIGDLRGQGLAPGHVAADLAAAVEWLLTQRAAGDASAC